MTFSYSLNNISSSSGNTFSAVPQAIPLTGNTNISGNFTSGVSTSTIPNAIPFASTQVPTSQPSGIPTSGTSFTSQIPTIPTSQPSGIPTSQTTQIPTIPTSQPSFTASQIPTIPTSNTSFTSQIPSTIPTSQPSFTTSGTSSISSSSFTTSGIFNNADAISFTPVQVASSIPAKKGATTRKPAARQPQVRKYVTETYDIAASDYKPLEPYVVAAKQLYPYNSQLISPYESTCPLRNLLICDYTSTTNVLYFDGTLLSVKLTEFKDEPERIYQVSLADLKKYYSLNSKSMVSFKTHFKVSPQAILNKYAAYAKDLLGEKEELNQKSTTQPHLKPENDAQIAKIDDILQTIKKESDKIQKSLNKSGSTQQPQNQAQTQQQSQTSDESDNSSIIYNTNTYPITDKGGKWLTISYLIPYLMFASPTFINHTSNLMTTLLIATSYNPTIQNNPKLNDWLSTMCNYQHEFTQLGDPKFKLRATKTEKSTEQKVEPIHKLVLQVPKPIIPRLINNSPSAQASYNAYVNQDVRNMFQTKQFDLAKLKAFYTNISQIGKLCHPADMLCVNAFLKLDSLQGQISILKVLPTQMNEAGEITDVELLKKIKGVKAKKVKVKNAPDQTLDSQDTFDYLVNNISSKATLQNLHKYGQFIQCPQFAIISEEQLKNMKTKVEGDKAKFDLLLNLSNAQDQIAQNGAKILGFESYLQSISTKKTSTATTRKRATKPKAGADIAFAEGDDVESSSEIADDYSSLLQTDNIGIGNNDYTSEIEPINIQ